MVEKPTMSIATIDASRIVLSSPTWPCSLKAQSPESGTIGAPQALRHCHPWPWHGLQQKRVQPFDEERRASRVPVVTVHHLAAVNAHFSLVND
jgi:hypothetical protein